MYFNSIAITSILAATALGAAVPVDLVERAGDLRGFDVSQAQAPSNPNFWKCAHDAGYGKAVIRGYRQACSTGGGVDPNFVPAYNAARAAGFNSVDAYMFPCTGTQPSSTCKTPQAQLDEFLKVILDNKIIVHRLWFDIEPATAAATGCNAWNLSKTANLALARQWVAALKATGLKWGIYGNGNQWTAMFPYRSSDVGSDLPLWAVQDDFKPGVSTVTTFMGGWTTALAKQYNLGTHTPECGGNLDLDSFAE